MWCPLSINASTFEPSHRRNSSVAPITRQYLWRASLLHHANIPLAFADQRSPNLFSMLTFGTRAASYSRLVEKCTMSWCPMLLVCALAVKHKAIVAIINVFRIFFLYRYLLLFIFIPHIRTKKSRRAQTLRDEKYLIFFTFRFIL